MSKYDQRRSKSSVSGDDGVRVIVKKKSAGPWGRGLPIAALLFMGGLGYLLIDTETTESPILASTPNTQTLKVQPPPVQAETSSEAELTPSVGSAETFVDDRTASELTEIEVLPPEVLPEESDDLASYFRPGDPEPTGAELIEAFHEAGIRTGIGAFNPPGTSPLLKGLVVPEDFELPEGFVRHHQVTDEGEPLEPILMFSPDIEFYEAAGNVPIPEDRIVTPELAPPGMPIREIQLPKP